MFAGFSLYVICVLLTNKLLKQTENMRNSCWYSLVILFTKCSCRDADNDDKLLVMDTDATNTYILIFAQRKITNWKKVIFGLNRHNFALWPSTSNWEEVNLFISVMILITCVINYFLSKRQKNLNSDLLFSMGYFPMGYIRKISTLNKLH